MNQIMSIAVDVHNATAALYLDARDLNRVHVDISDCLAQATYCGRKEEFSVEKFRSKMLLVAAYCLLASGDDIDVVLQERLRQDKIWGDDFDRMNTANDWHAYISHYLAKALRPNQNYAENMVKASGIAQAAILMVDRYGAPAPRHYENLPGAGATCEKCGSPEGKNHVCCSACHCIHPEGTICPPHEVR